MKAYYVFTIQRGLIKYTDFDIYDEAYIYQNPGLVEMPPKNFIRLAIF